MRPILFDTHVHTRETSLCAAVPAVQLVRMYKTAGYDGIVITDHYHRQFFEPLKGLPWEEQADRFLRGYRAAREEGERVGLTVLPGMEIRFPENDNDYLVFGLDEDYIQKHPMLFLLGLTRFREAVQEAGLVIVQAHPYRPGCTPADPMLLDAVEVYNGNPRHDSHNDLARAFAEQHRLPVTSGSDFHQQEDLARGGIQLPQMPASPGELAAMLKNGRVAETIQTV